MTFRDVRIGDCESHAIRNKPLYMGPALQLCLPFAITAMFYLVYLSCILFVIATARFIIVTGLWDSLFPQMHQVPGTSHYVIIFDSNSPARGILTNAIGSIPRAAIERATAMINLISDQPETANAQFIIALHHHVVLPDLDAPLFWRKTWQTAAMVLDNAKEFMHFIWKLNRNAVILHGHRHWDSSRTYDWDWKGTSGRIDGEIGNTYVVSAPSTLLGAENEKVHFRRGRSHLVDIGISERGCTVRRRSVI